MEIDLRKAAIHNLGCKVNSYEAEAMEQLLLDAGYTIVDFDGDEPADVYIINTCSVTNIADRKSRQMLHKAKKLNPDAVVVAAGCYAQSDSAKLDEDSAVDIILGNNCKIDIVTMLDEYFNNNTRHKETSEKLIDMSHEKHYENLKINKVNEHTRAYIKIQDGCNQFCTYCIIPYLRGRIRSREILDITEEIVHLVAAGYKEFVLTGIHLSSYGMDNMNYNKVKDDEKKLYALGKNCGSEEEPCTEEVSNVPENTLIDVIEAVNDIEGVERIRLGSLEPRIITDDFMGRLSRLDKVCPHFHLSLQSGCDKTLRRMNRRYTTEEYLKGCEIIRRYYKNPAITTDVIVGFPGESDEDFEVTKDFLRKVDFYEMHIFKYSRRKGTAADKMPDQIDEKIKTERSKILLAEEKKMSADYRKKFIGSECDVLIEEKIQLDGKEYYTGYSRNYIKIVIPAENLEEGYKIQAKEENYQIENKIYDVKIEKCISDEILLASCVFNPVNIKTK